MSAKYIIYTVQMQKQKTRNAFIFMNIKGKNTFLLFFLEYFDTALIIQERLKICVGLTVIAHMNVFL